MWKGLRHCLSNNTSPNQTNVTSGRNYHVQPMAIADAGEVAALEQELSRTPWSQSSIQTALLDAEVGYVVRWRTPANRRSLAGYAISHSLFDQAQLLIIGVVPALQGHGIGRCLMRHAMQVAQRSGARQMTLEVRQSNRRAITLYESLRFTRLHELPRYYVGKHQVEDGVRMICYDLLVND